MYKWLCDCNDVSVASLVTRNSQSDLVSQLQPDLLRPVRYDYLVPEEVLSVPGDGAIHMNPSLLRYNRGRSPKVWLIVEGTPACVSIQYMDSEFDNGEVIARRTSRWTSLTREKSTRSASNECSSTCSPTFGTSSRQVMLNPHTSPTKGRTTRPRTPSACENTTQVWRYKSGYLSTGSMHSRFCCSTTLICRSTVRPATSTSIYGEALRRKTQRQLTSLILTALNTELDGILLQSPDPADKVRNVIVAHCRK